MHERVASELWRVQLFVADSNQVKADRFPHCPLEPRQGALQPAVDRALAHRVLEVVVVLAQLVCEPRAGIRRHAGIIALEAGQECCDVGLGVERHVLVQSGEEQHKLLVDVCRPARAIRSSLPGGSNNNRADEA